MTGGPVESAAPAGAPTLIVVVLYRSGQTAAPEDGVTLLGLETALASRPELQRSYSVLLWDNSPEPAPEWPRSFRYCHAPVNDGVAGAYNGALEIAQREGHQWLLLLDDDTAVTLEFLSGMSASIERCREHDRIAAIAPLLHERDFPLSPQQVLRHRCRPVAPAPARLLEGECFAANSGVALRVRDLAAIGGYSLDFWLDYSDIYVFHRLFAAGKRVYLAADLRLQHSMTMLDYDGRMSPGRYSNFLHAEQAFFDLYRDPGQNAVQLLRLLARVVRQRRYRNPAFSRLTAAFLLYRLRTGKSERLRRWSERRLERLGPNATSGKGE